MNIETKFNVGDLLVSKFQRNLLKENDSGDYSQIVCFEVIDINTGTCYAGTQVFYVCRSVHGITLVKYKENKKVTTFIDVSLGKPPDKEYTTYREDELVVAPQEYINVILNKENYENKDE